MSKTEEALKPCQHCQFDSAYVAQWVATFMQESFFVECPSCRARGPWKETEEEAIKAWNTRAQPEGQSE